MAEKPMEETDAEENAENADQTCRSTDSTGWRTKVKKLSSKATTPWKWLKKKFQRRRDSFPEAEGPENQLDRVEWYVDLQKSETKSTIVIAGARCGYNTCSFYYASWYWDQSKQFMELCEYPFDTLGGAHSVCHVPNGFALTGGECQDMCLVFNLMEQTCTVLPRMLRTRYHHASVCIQNVLYVIGGNPRRPQAVESLKLDGGVAWEREPDVPTKAGLLKAVEVNDTLYTFDGCKDKQLWKLDIGEKVWIKLAALHLPDQDPKSDCCFDVGMVAVGDKICVAGGENKICAWYDTTTDSWSIGPSLNEFHHFGALVYFQDELLMLGGCNPFMGSSVIEQWNPEDGSWTVTSLQMPDSPMWSHSAFVLDVPTENQTKIDRDISTEECPKSETEIQ